MSHDECRICGAEYVPDPTKEQPVCNDCTSLMQEARNYSNRAQYQNDFTDDSLEQVVKKMAYTLGKLELLENEIRRRGEQEFLKLVMAGENNDTTGDTQSN